jgi:hypothetical protein
MLVLPEACTQNTLETKEAVVVPMAQRPPQPSLVVSLVADGMTVGLSSHGERMGARLGARMIYLEDAKSSSTPKQIPSTGFLHHAKGNHANS